MGGLPRRQVLAAIALTPAVLALGGTTSGCSVLGEDRPDPLLGLAAQAHADAALAAAVLAADDRAAARVEPVRTAREAHATALEAEIARRRGDAAGTAGPTPVAAPAAQPATLPATLAALRDALAAAQRAAGQAVLTLPVDRVGLVASVAACCGAYVELLT